MQTLRPLGILLALATLNVRDACAVSAIDFTSAPNSLTGEFSLGFAFTVNSPFDVLALGFYDEGQDGLLGSHEVGIFDATTQALLVSTIVLPSDPLDGFFRYRAISPFPLAVGNYVAAAVTGADPFAFNTVGFSTAPQITFLQYRQSAEGVNALLYPAISDPSFGVIDGDFGPNLLLRGVPEPGSLLMLSGGLAVIAMNALRGKFPRRRRRLTR